MTHLRVIDGGRDDTWWAHAACAGTDPDVFFPTPGRGMPIDQAIKQAKRYCNTCPVRTECLNYALDHHIKYGLWGGETERGRARIQRARKTAIGAA